VYIPRRIKQPKLSKSSLIMAEYIGEQLSISPADAIERSLTLALRMRGITLGFHGIFNKENSESA
jgi:hypothetical protein